MFKSRLKNESVLSSLLVECPVRALISDAIETVHDAFAGTEKAEFLRQLSHHRTGDACRLIFSKKRRAILSLGRRASTLTRASRTRACPTARPSRRHQRHFTLTHKLSLKARPPSGCSSWPLQAGLRLPECIGRRALIVLTDGAKRPKKLKWETVLARK
jgi:hypothetical protein